MMGRMRRQVESIGFGWASFLVPPLQLSGDGAFAFWFSGNWLGIGRWFPS